MAVVYSVPWCLAHQQQREDGAYVAEDVSIPYGTSSCLSLFIIIIIIIAGVVIDVIVCSNSRYDSFLFHYLL